VREPLAGLEAVSPVGPDVPHAVTGHRNAVDALLTMHECPARRIEEVSLVVCSLRCSWDRGVRAPSFDVVASSRRRRRACSFVVFLSRLVSSRVLSIVRWRRNWPLPERARLCCEETRRADRHASPVLRRHACSI